MYSRSRRRTSQRRTRRRTYTRRPSRARRSYTPRRKFPRRRGHSTRSLLNKTSQKKRDVLQNWTNINGDGSPPDNANYVPSGATIDGNPGTWTTMVFCPTARSSEDQQGALGSKANTTVRTSTTCFMRGYKETTRVATISGRGWQWRRICFTMKGDALNDGNQDPDTSLVFRENSQGYTRLMYQQTNGVAEGLIFRGEQNVDWSDPLIAQTDSHRVTILSDKLYNIRSGNSDGVTRTYKNWYPMNKNLVYEDDEVGNQMNPSAFSTEGKPGMGDYYIVDILRANRGSTSTDTLTFEPAGIIYWHEK